MGFYTWYNRYTHWRRAFLWLPIPHRTWKDTTVLCSVYGFPWTRIIRMRCQPVSGRDVYSWRQQKLPDFHADFIDRFQRWWPWSLIALTAPMILQVIINIMVLVRSQGYIFLLKYYRITFLFVEVNKDKCKMYLSVTSLTWDDRTRSWQLDGTRTPPGAE